ncbi:hypothetical protein ACCT14_33415 [Rhizobium brockwellii]
MGQSLLQNGLFQRGKVKVGIAGGDTANNTGTTCWEIFSLPAGLKIELRLFLVGAVFSLVRQR